MNTYKITNTTIAKSIKLGFDFEQFEDDTQLSTIYKSILDFLHENFEKLDLFFDECEVTSYGSSQNVSHGKYTSSGDIIRWDYYERKPRQKVVHSSYLYIDDYGTPLNMSLWCWSRPEETED